MEFREAGVLARCVRSVLAGRTTLLDAHCSVRAFCLCLCLLVGWVTTSSAAPQKVEGRHRLELSWQAPSLCPESEVFIAEVGALTASIDWVRGDPSAKEVRLVLVPGEGRGSLVMLDQGEVILSRDVTEQDCAVMVRGLAFVLAVLLDPSVKMEEAPNPEAETEESPLEKGEVVEKEEEAERATPVLSDEPRNRPINDPPPPQQLVPRPLASTSRRLELAETSRASRDQSVRGVAALPSWSIFAGGSLESGLNTGWSPGATASFQGRLHRVDQGDLNLRSARLLSPSFRIGGQFASSPAAESGGSLAVFRYGGFLQLCPVWVPTTARIRVNPCLSGELGTVRAEGRGVDHSIPARRTWGALVALARMDVTLGRFDVGLSAGSRIHVTRYGFSVDSEETDPSSEILYETPRFSAVFELSVGQEIFRSKNVRRDIH